jgi:hypothetical protein
MAKSGLLRTRTPARNRFAANLTSVITALSISRLDSLFRPDRWSAKLIGISATCAPSRTYSLRISTNGE